MALRVFSALLATVAVHHVALAASVKSDVAEMGRASSAADALFIRPQTLTDLCPRRTGQNEVMYACPSSSGELHSTSYPCIRYDDLCNGIRDCPQGEDEIYAFCMFHKFYEVQQKHVVQELKKIRDTLQDQYNALAAELEGFPESK